MGEVAERYRFEAENLLTGMPKRLKVLEGAEWHDLAALMARRREDALIAAPPRAVRRPTPGPPAAPDISAAPATELAPAPVSPGGIMAEPPGRSRCLRRTPLTPTTGRLGRSGSPATSTTGATPTTRPPPKPGADTGAGTDGGAGRPEGWGAAAAASRGAVVVPITGHDERGPTGPGTATGSDRAAP